jgi:signal transduction histidine kinase
MKMLVQAAVERDDGKGLCGQQLLVVEEEIQRLEKSIQDFLDFARPTTLEIHPFDLRSAIEQTVDLLSVRAERQRVEIVDAFPHHPVVVQGDGAQIRQVLLNLLLNSLDALPNGGTIVVEVSRASTRDQNLKGIGDSRDWISVRVRDNGPGLSAEALGRVFEPFVSSKETGTGLGLSICRRIVEAHGGLIVAANQATGGAVFTIYLPLPANAYEEMERLSLLSTS